MEVMRTVHVPQLEAVAAFKASLTAATAVCGSWPLTAANINAGSPRSVTCTSTEELVGEEDESEPEVQSPQFPVLHTRIVIGYPGPVLGHL